MPFSLFRQMRQKKPEFQLQGRPGHSDNVVRHITARQNVEIQVTYDGLSWGNFQGKPHGLLFFSIQLRQRHGAILKDAQITFSFDCHPADKECHTPAGCNGCQNPNQRNRGVVEVSLPNAMYGKTVDRHIARHDQYQLGPNFEFASIGSFTLGSWQRDTEYIEDRARSWRFDSRALPPRKYNYFPAHTDVSYEWQHNENDIEKYPRTINVAVVVDCHQGHPLPLTVCIDGSLGGSFTYFAKLKDHEVYIATEDNLRDRDALIQRIERLNYQGDTLGVVTFEVECTDTSEDGVTVKLLGDGDILGCWEPGRASALTKTRDDGITAVWKIDKLVNMWKDFRYKFIKVSDGGREVVWELGHNRIYSIKEVGTKLKQRRPDWGGGQ